MTYDSRFMTYNLRITMHESTKGFPRIGLTTHQHNTELTTEQQIHDSGLGDTLIQ